MRPWSATKNEKATRCVPGTDVDSSTEWYGIVLVCIISHVKRARTNKYEKVQIRRLGRENAKWPLSVAFVPAKATKITISPRTRTAFEAV